MLPAFPVAQPALVLAAADGRVASMVDLASTLRACVHRPDRTEGSRVTVRFRLGPHGALQGSPRVVASSSAVSESDRRALDAAVLEALRRCTPVDLDSGFAASLAGRTLELRLLGGPPPQGI